MTPPAKPGELFFGGSGEPRHLIRQRSALPPVSLRVGRFTGLTRHRRVIQHREPLEGKARGWADRCGNISKMWKNARNLLPEMVVLGGNAEMGVDKWGECGIICVSAGVLLL